jgi:hypothetical protein
MKRSMAGLATALAATLLVVGVTVVQGTWTERWTQVADRGALERAAQILEEAFPQEFGPWEAEEELETNPREMDRAGAVGHISRLYRNKRTNMRISTFVVCALPHDASGHTPDRCYPGAGFEIGESEHRHEVPLADGREAETFTGTFRREGQTLRIFWTYGIPERDGKSVAAVVDAGTSEGPVLKWIAPGIARIALQGQQAVYKLYAIVDQTRYTGAQAMQEGTEFLNQVITAFDQRLAARRAAAVGAPTGEAEPAAAAEASVGREPPAAG